MVMKRGVLALGVQRIYGGCGDEYRGRGEWGRLGAGDAAKERVELGRETGQRRENGEGEKKLRRPCSKQGNPPWD